MLVAEVPEFADDLVDQTTRLTCRRADGPQLSSFLQRVEHVSLPDVISQILPKREL